MQNNGQNYRIVLVNDNGFPSCECESWKNKMLPCKHMFATFESYPDKNWYSFPDKYKNSPYFQLDIPDDNMTESFTNETDPDKNVTEFVHNLIVTDEGDGEMCTEITDITTNKDNNFSYETLPKKQYAKKSKTAMCRQLLKQ